MGAFAAPASAADAWLDVSAGHDYTCGVKQDNTLWCWGYSSSRNYGNRPVQLSPSIAWASVSVAIHHACALTTAGEPYCWGGNRYGELGVFDNTTYTTPRSVAIARTMVTISAGGSSTCAIDRLQNLFCWGDNRSGELGLGTTTNWNYPQLVGAGWSTVSVGDFTACGVGTDATGYCWGSNYYGELGIGDVAEDQLSPVPVAGGLAWSDIDNSSDHSCGVTTSHRLYCWGNNGNGELGVGFPTAFNTPVRVTNVSTWSLRGRWRPPVEPHL